MKYDKNTCTIGILRYSINNNKGYCCQMANGIDLFVYWIHLVIIRTSRSRYHCAKLRGGRIRFPFAIFYWSFANAVLVSLLCAKGKDGKEGRRREVNGCEKKCSLNGLLLKWKFINHCIVHFAWCLYPVIRVCTVLFSDAYLTRITMLHALHSLFDFY